MNIERNERNFDFGLNRTQLSLENKNNIYSKHFDNDFEEPIRFVNKENYNSYDSFLHDEPVEYTGDLQISKGSSIESENSQLHVKIGSGWWNGSSVSSDENLSNEEKQYFQKNKPALVAIMQQIQGDVDTRNIGRAAAILSDSAQAGLQGSDARVFKSLSNELQSVVDNAKTFNNYSFKEGYVDANKMGDVYNSKQTLEYLKSDKGQAVLQELGIDIEQVNSLNPDNLDVDSRGLLKVGDKRIMLSPDKLSVIGESTKIGQTRDNVMTAEISTYDLDKNYKPDINQTVTQETPNNQYWADESYQKYHVDGDWTDLHLQDEGGNNVHLPRGMKISTIAMQDRLDSDKNGDFAKRLVEVSGKNIEDLTCYYNHAYYKDENGTEHQFYYDETNDKFINSNVTPNKEMGGYDVEVCVPKIQDTDVTSTFDKLNETDKRLVMELVHQIIEASQNQNNVSQMSFETPQYNSFQNMSLTVDNFVQQYQKLGDKSNIEDVAQNVFDNLQNQYPNIDNNLLNIAKEMIKKS